MTTLTSLNKSLNFGSGCSMLLILDQQRIMDQTPRVLEELAKGRLEVLMDLVKVGIKKAICTVDVLLDHPKVDEFVLLPLIARRLQERPGCFLSLDSSKVAALEAALAAV